MSTKLEKLKHTNLELKEIINNSWDGIAIIDRTSKLIYVNDALIPMLGFTKEELLESEFTSFINEEYIEPFYKLLKDNIKNSYFTDISLVCTRKDGKPIYLKITVSLMLNKKYFVVNAKDITKEISDDEILNNYVISSHTDVDGVITQVSDAFCKLTGYSKKELINQTHTILKHPDTPKELFTNLWDTIKDGKEWSGRMKNRKKNGDLFWVDMRIKPINNKYGDIIGFTTLMFDITNELKLDEEIINQNLKLDIMRETIQTISHEWRQPLNIISIQAQKLSMDMEEDKDSTDVLQQIQDRANELSNTIENFKTLVEFKGIKEEVNLNELIEQTITQFKTNKAIEFETNLVNLPQAEIYKDRVYTVFNSLFQNSYDAMLKHSITDAKIKINASCEKGTLYFEIIDNCGGIDESVINRAFEPYYSTKTEQHGVGLGLYICKNILELHLNGTITLLNNGKGTTVKITLPI